MTYVTRRADFQNTTDRAAFLALMDAYAADPMGDGRPLAAIVKARLVDAFATFPTSLAFLAFAADGPPAGIATCFVGFSTFAARPLLNLSDFYVLPAHRGAGVGQHLLAAMERHAVAIGCCKLSLEVQENNHRARRIYEAAGFHQARYTPEAGGSLYYVKPLAASDTA